MRDNKEATITFRLSEQEKAQLWAIAERKDSSLSQLVRHCVHYYLTMHQEEAAQ